MFKQLETNTEPEMRARLDEIPTCYEIKFSGYTFVAAKRKTRFVAIVEIPDKQRVKEWKQTTLAHE